MGTKQVNRKIPVSDKHVKKTKRILVSSLLLPVSSPSYKPSGLWKPSMGFCFSYWSPSILWQILLGTYSVAFLFPLFHSPVPLYPLFFLPSLDLTSDHAMQTPTQLSFLLLSPVSDIWCLWNLHLKKKKTWMSEFTFIPFTCFQPIISACQDIFESRFCHPLY